MSTRSGKLVATDKSTIISEPFLNAIVVEDGEGDGCLPNPPCANESGRFELYGVTDDLLD